MKVEDQYSKFNFSKSFLVVCMDNSSMDYITIPNLTIGKTYQVSMFKANDQKTELYHVIDDEGSEIRCYTTRFRLLSDIRNEKLNQIL